MKPKHLETCHNVTQHSGIQKSRIITLTILKQSQCHWHNDTHHNETKHKYTRCDDSQHNDILHDSTEHKTLSMKLGSAISNGREPNSFLGWVFNSKLDRIAMLCSKCMAWHAATSRVENSTQGLSCQLKFVHDEIFSTIKLSILALRIIILSIEKTILSLTTPRIS